MLTPTEDTSRVQAKVRDAEVAHRYFQRTPIKSKAWLRASTTPKPRGERYSNWKDTLTPLPLIMIAESSPHRNADSTMSRAGDEEMRGDNETAQ